MFIAFTFVFHMLIIENTCNLLWFLVLGSSIFTISFYFFRYESEKPWVYSFLVLGKNRFFGFSVDFFRSWCRYRCTIFRGACKGKFQPYGHTRLSLSVVTRMEIKSLICNRTSNSVMTKRSSFYKRHIFDFTIMFCGVIFFFFFFFFFFCNTLILSV